MFQNLITALMDIPLMCHTFLVHCTFLFIHKQIQLLNERTKMHYNIHDVDLIRDELKILFLKMKQCLKFCLFICKVIYIISYVLQVIWSCKL